MITMSLSELANLLDSSYTGKPLTFQGISTDTRTLKPGNLFIALKGDRYDGHQFLETAKNAGAIGAIVSEKSALDIPQIVVPDTLIAMGKLSAKWRDHCGTILIGITGSNGKTTLKNMMASILREATGHDKVLATEGNLNNAIGVPLTLCRLDPSHTFGVIEMGMNHFGEIAYLTHLTKPAVATITNAAAAHLEGLGSVAGVAKAKGEIFEGLNQQGVAILNADDDYFSYWKDLIKGHKFLSFGLKNRADVTAEIFDHGILVYTPLGKIEIQLPLLGMHNVMNALAACASAIALEIDLNEIKKGLENVKPAPGRMHQYFHSSGAHIIDDTYNANPISLQAAVDTLAAYQGTRILILGDMRELGPDELKIHQTAGENIRNAHIDLLFTFGELSAETSQAFGKNAAHFTDKKILMDALTPYLKNDTHILVKGSRSMKMETIIATLIKDIVHTH